MQRWMLVAAGLVLGACKAGKPSAPAPALQQAAETRAATEVHPTSTAPKVEPLPVCKGGGLDPLSAARKYYDASRHQEALSCAAEACAVYPDNPLAHSEKGAALAALGKLEDAQVAYARALALDPDNLDALLGAAHLYGVRLPSTRDHDELASVYAEHGLALAEEQQDKHLTFEFALLSAMAFNDLGSPKDALERADRALLMKQGDKEASYERAIALFELCRFAEAKPLFVAMLNDKERAAHAHHHLGLILEREGKWKEAEQHLQTAVRLDPEEFPPPQLLSEKDFKAEVERAVAALPADMSKDLEGVPVTAEEIPKDDDLLSGDPPLSPAILGLFRGPPIGERCEAGEDPCRSVALYRRNLARAVKTKDELIEQIRVTLWHEVGHLRGEDDYELAARGLE